ncbi:CHAT domain-containing protein [Brasilonema sennae]|uniref:nSTAND1 domain-containing NTPase n=1 Tax=Brasilonema sennae TaxID=1397703 RepID=UPI001FE7ADFF|nr:CHAT domain-containing protein [Brasilonema sennae]
MSNGDGRMHHQMSKTVIINMGSGDLYQGFPRVTAQLWKEGNLLPEQFLGSLPPAPHLVELCRNWQSNYQSLCDRQQLRFQGEDDDELEIDADGVTNVSVLSFNDLCHNLQLGINQWLSSDDYLNISLQLRSHLHPLEEIRVMMETNDDLLRRLPWHRYDFYRDYPRAEMALCQSEYKQAQLSQRRNGDKVRILAVLGNSKGIDLEAETRFLLSLQDAEVVFRVNPTRQELNTQLWDVRGWDILFFAGHSRTEGKTGRIYINENKTNNSLTIEQLEEALKAAIEKGLQLAIFNSCDGLGLALALENLHIPSVIVMREPVPNLVAQEFFKYFLQGFALERLSFYLAVQQARRKLQGLEDDFPGASWLPVICINPAVEPPTWLKLGGIPPCPYRGLFAFREEDAHLFKGREQFTQQLLRAVKRKPLVAVVGPSGSGKSSVVFAGLIPQLRLENNVRWQIVWFRPGNNPIEALAVAIAPQMHSLTTEASHHSAGSVASPQNQNRTGNMPIPQDNDDNQRLVEMELEIALRQDKKALSKVIEKIVQRGVRLLLIADQFEELYTLSPESERQFLLDALLTASDRAPKFTLVLTLRADFFGHALSYRPLSDALQGAVQNLGPMSRQELRKAIEEPAAQMQVGLEKELTNKLISDVKEQSGSLPLLEFALTELWSKQKYGLLTHSAYEEIGGVEEALANHAESVYAEVDEADQIRTQRLFMQLVCLGEGAEATRRIATRDQVNLENWDLVTRLASTRLVVTNRNSSNEETVEIVHEALIRSWGRLQHWIQVDGEFRRWQEQLRATMRQWETSGFDSGALLRGVPLTVAEDWLQKRSNEMTQQERDFIQASASQRDREKLERDRRRQLTIITLGSFSAVALILAGVAGMGWWNAAISQITSLTITSDELLNSDGAKALKASLKAVVKMQHTPLVDADTRTQVELTLLNTVDNVAAPNNLGGHTNTVNGVNFSPDGKILATVSSDKTVKLWNPATGQVIKTLSGHTNMVSGTSFSPDGKILATASCDKTVKLWDTATLKEIKTLSGHTNSVYGTSFSPDGKILATASGDKTVKLWDTATLKEIKTLSGHTNWFGARASARMAKCSQRPVVTTR